MFHLIATQLRELDFYFFFSNTLTYNVLVKKNHRSTTFR
jgi:hypothetical protein